MLERSLYAPLTKGGMQEGFALYRIADGSPGLKPFDLGGCAPDGRGVGIEVKVYDARNLCVTAPPWRIFARHQLAWLRQFILCGAYSIVVIKVPAEGLVHAIRLDDPEFASGPLRAFKHVTLKHAGDRYLGLRDLLRSPEDLR